MASNSFLFPPTVPSLSSAPGSPVNGMAYYDTTLNKYRVYTNGAWATAGAMTFEIPVLLLSPAVASYRIRTYASRAGTLTDCKAAVTDTGSVTCTLQINGTNVTGFPGTINTTPGNASLTANNTYSVGNYFDLVISATSGTPGLVQFTLLGTHSN